MTGNDIAVWRARFGIDRRRSGRPFAAAEHVGADHEVLRRVERLAGPIMLSHQPGLPPSWLMPAACASPEKACRIRIALDRLEFSSP